tara:strand:- start:384 stop:689 length:306 start_codon:yes stop_codon:yes gene_type:complete
MMKRFAILLALVLGSQAFAQEAKTIKGITEGYDEVEFVLLSKSDTTAVVKNCNLPQDLGLKKEQEVFFTDNGKFTLFVDGAFRIIYGELFDGRKSSSISRL